MSNKQKFEYEEAYLIFLADCMCVAERKLDKQIAARVMAVRANKIFSGHVPTHERVSEVKEIILASAI